MKLKSAEEWREIEKGARFADPVRPSRDAYNFLRDLLEGGYWLKSTITLRDYASGHALAREARLIVDYGTGLCLDCYRSDMPGSGHHEDGKCPAELSK